MDGGVMAAVLQLLDEEAVDTGVDGEWGDGT
jgi:hypothetical protein